MATIPLMMSVEEYLHTEFRPDCDYVEGQIEERHLGELEHGRLQKALVSMLSGREREWQVEIVFEVRVQVAAERFRVPDVCVVQAQPRESRIIRRPPLFCIEVMSPEERFPRLTEKIEDYHRMGVEVVWIFDPETKQVWVSEPGGMREFTGDVLKVNGTPIELILGEAFALADGPR